jgi:hypothetical protein
MLPEELVHQVIAYLISDEMSVYIKQLDSSVSFSHIIGCRKEFNEFSFTKLDTREVVGRLLKCFGFRECYIPLPLIVHGDCIAVHQLDQTEFDPLYKYPLFPFITL